MRNNLNKLKEENFYKTITIEKLENRLKELEKTLNLQFSIVTTLSTSSLLSDTTSMVLKSLSQALSLDEMAILLCEDESGRLRHFSSFGLSPEKQKAVFEPGEGISGLTLCDKKTHFLERAGEHSQFKHWKIKTDEYNKKTFIAIPLIDKERAIGVITASAHAIPTTYQKTLESFAALMTPIIELQRAKSLQEKNFFETIKRVMDFTEALSPYTSGHSYRVSRYATRLAKELGLSDSQVEIVEKGSRLHDVGKIAMIYLVKKQGKLTGIQKKIMKTHPLLGEQFVSGFDFLKDTIPIIKYHHERFDGKGYPGELKGENIPMPTKIVTVAEVYDAMTTDRSYRGQHSFRYAVAQLKRYSGKQFDPEVVKAFIRDKHSLKVFTEKVKKESEELLSF